MISALKDTSSYEVVLSHAVHPSTHKYTVCFREDIFEELGLCMFEDFTVHGAHYSRLAVPCHAGGTLTCQWIVFDQRHVTCSRGVPFLLRVVGFKNAGHLFLFDLSRISIHFAFEGFAFAEPQFSSSCISMAKI